MGSRWVDLWSPTKSVEFQGETGIRGANSLRDSLVAAYYATLWHEMRQMEDEHCLEPLDAETLALGKAVGARALEPSERARVIAALGLSPPCG